LLRDRCYYNHDTGEVREEVLVRGGYTELADWLGLNRPKTIWEWIRDVQGPVSAFVCILPNLDQDDADSMRLRVRMEEPIFEGASDTIRMAQLAPVGGADDTNRNGANGTNTMAEMAPLDGADGTFAWREWHGLKHLNSSPNTLKKNPLPPPKTVRGSGSIFLGFTEDPYPISCPPEGHERTPGKKRLRAGVLCLGYFMPVARPGGEFKARYLTHLHRSKITQIEVQVVRTTAWRPCLPRSLYDSSAGL